MASTKISALTTDSAPVRTTDYVPTYKAAGVVNRKVLLSDLGGYTVFANCAVFTPADSSTYFIGAPYTRPLGTTGANIRIRFPRAGVITRIYIETVVNTTLGTSENVTASFRLNDTTDTTITSVLQLDQSVESFNNTALSISVAATDYGSIKLVTPAWVTNPVDVYFHAMIWVT